MRILFDFLTLSYKNGAAEYARRVFYALLEKIVEEKGLKQVTDTGAIEKLIDDLLASATDNVAAYRGGKVGLFGWFVGQIMKQSQGKANPQVVNELLKKKLG